ncbi:unnamed protein product, partial [Amoebophrya sp. A120]|eukprot:GSA120T00006821001.1
MRPLGLPLRPPGPRKARRTVGLGASARPPGKWARRSPEGACVARRPGPRMNEGRGGPGAVLVSSGLPGLRAGGSRARTSRRKRRPRPPPRTETEEGRPFFGCRRVPEWNEKEKAKKGPGPFRPPRLVSSRPPARPRRCSIVAWASGRPPGRRGRGAALARPSYLAPPWFVRWQASPPVAPVKPRAWRARARPFGRALDPGRVGPQQAPPPHVGASWVAAPSKFCSHRCATPAWATQHDKRQRAGDYVPPLPAGARSLRACKAAALLAWALGGRAPCLSLPAPRSFVVLVWLPGDSVGPVPLLQQEWNCLQLAFVPISESPHRSQIHSFAVACSGS